MLLRNLLANSLEAKHTWCEAHRAPSYHSGWRSDPCLVIIIPLDSCYHLTLASEPGKPLKSLSAKPGEMLVIPPGLRHSFDAESCTIRGINVKYGLLGGVELFSFFSVPNLVTSAHVLEVKALIEELVSIGGRRSSIYPVPQLETAKELDISDIVSERRILIRLLEVILSLSTALPKLEQRMFKLNRVEPALKRLLKEYSKPLSIAELAKLCQLSERHFRAIFQDSVGQSPQKYLTGLRMEKAMELLAASSGAISDVARNLGFFDQSHFSNTFKRHFGISPQMYRRELQRGLAGQ